MRVPQQTSQGHKRKVTYFLNTHSISSQTFNCKIKNISLQIGLRSENHQTTINIWTDALAMEIIRLGSVRMANPISIGGCPASPNGDKKGGHIFGRLVSTRG